MDNKAKQQAPNSELGEGIVVSFRLDQWFPELPKETLAKLKLFHTELLKANKTAQLISIKTMPMADAIHFADCIFASRLIMKRSDITEIHDFGSGCGFPGLVLAILYPTLKVNLIDSDPKKIEFLKAMSASLSLKNVAIHARSIEALPDKSIKFAVTRGLSNISKTILLSRKCFMKGGVLFHMKGEEWASELAAIPTQLCSFWSPSLVGEYKLPVGEVKFAVVSTDKIAD